MKIFDWSNRLFKTKKLFQRSHDLEKVAGKKTRSEPVDCTRRLPKEEN